MTNNNCIRDCADPVQIQSGKDLLMNFSADLHSLSGVFNLVGNEVRFKILFLLYREKNLCVCDLRDILEMKIPAVSQHLRKMKDGGLIIPRKEKQTIFYSISEVHIPLLEIIFGQIQAQKIAV